MHLVHTKKQKGFILVETIVYVILLGILCFTTVEVLITMSRSYGRLRVSQNINHSAVVTLERLTREIRAGDSIDMGASTLNATSGVLMLNGTDDSGNPRTVEFRLNNGIVDLSENSVFSGPLTSTRASTTKLLFRSLTSSSSNAVQVEMTIQAGEGTFTKTAHFYTSAILRGSY